MILQSFIDTRLVNRFRKVPNIVAIILVLSGTLVLIGWAYNIEVLKSVVPGFVSMKANTAICFIIFGLGLALAGYRLSHKGSAMTAQFLVFVAVSISALSLLEYAIGDLKIDQLMFKDSVSFGLSAPGRMSPITGACFVLLGISFLITLRHGSVVVSQVLAMTSAIVVLTIIVGHFSDEIAIQKLTHTSGVAIITSILILLLSLALLATRCEQGLTALLCSSSTGGVIIRRLLPFALAAPVIVAWLRMIGQRAGLFESEVGAAAVILFTICGLTVLLSINARALHRLDEKRQAMQEELQKNQTLLRSILDNAPASIYVKDTEGRFLLLNHQVEVTLGREHSDLVGRSSYELYPTDLANELRAGDELVILSGSPLRSEITVPLHDGSRTFIILRFPLLNAAGEVYAVGGVATDITDRKQTELKLQQLNESVRNYASRLQLANKELEAFSYSVSHDLRAPLRSIDGFSRVLTEDYAEKLDEDGRSHLNRIRAATDRMARLIDDLLGMSRVARAEMSFQQVDLSTLARSVDEELRRQQPERKVDFVCRPGLSVHGDSRLLRIVIQNLLENAWKYTSKHSGARIEFGSKKDNDRVTYFVQDDGAGFDMAYADKLFGAFQRLHGSDEFDGTGIGLATVQRIVHRHGGEVWGEGKVEGGATFCFTLASEGGTNGREDHTLGRRQSGRRGVDTTRVEEKQYT